MKLIHVCISGVQKWDFKKFNILFFIISHVSDQFTTTKFKTDLMIDVITKRFRNQFNY